jgi:hypothetical protein
MMMATQAMVDLGFTPERFPAGTHICQIYNDEDERNDALLHFLASGLRAGECTACFSENISEGEIDDFLHGQSLSLSEAKSRGAFALSKTSEVYYQGGTFDPARMLGLLTEYHAKSVSSGFPNARVIGEMTAEIERIPGGSRLLEYESKVSQLLRQRPITAVCQYDARAFSGATIMEVLSVHPMMVVRGSVVRNPFYLSPEEYLS